MENDVEYLFSECLSIGVAIHLQLIEVLRLFAHFEQDADRFVVLSFAENFIERWLVGFC